MTSEFNIPIIYGRIISTLAGRTSAEMQAIIAGTGLDQTEHAGSLGYMSNAQYQRLLENAIRVSSDPLIALKIGARIPPSVHGTLNEAVVSSKTLRIGIETLVNYTKLRSPFCDISLIDEGKKASLLFELQPVLGLQSISALDFIVSTINHGILNIGCKYPVTYQLALSRPAPENAALFIDILGCDVAFGQSQDAFIFNRNDMDVELLGADDVVFRKAVESLRNTLFSLEYLDSTEDSIISFFIKNRGHICTLEDVAQCMATTPRTLQRRLRCEGLSFQTLRDDWLSKQARNHLDDDGLSVEVTAALLGYSDAANFRRAFKRWFGLAPKYYRL